MLWAGEFVSFLTAIQPVWFGVIAGPRDVEGRVWRLSVHLMFLLCLTVILLTSLTDDLYMCAMKFLWHRRLICGLASLVCTVKFTICEHKFCPLC